MSRYSFQFLWYLVLHFVIQLTHRVRNKNFPDPDQTGIRFFCIVVYLKEFYLAMLFGDSRKKDYFGPEKNAQKQV
jgi:hypothetical protein